MNTDIIRLLLVEDNPGDAVLIEEMLRDESEFEFNITAAGTLEAACRAMSLNPIDAVLLDLNLPDSTGIETLQRIRGVRMDVPIVVLSGNCSERIEIEALHNGALDLIGKNERPGRKIVRSLKYAMARNRVQEKQRQIERLVSASPGAVVVASVQGVIQLVNEAALRLFGKTQQEFIGQSLPFAIKEGLKTKIEISRSEEVRIAEMQVVGLEWDSQPAMLVSLHDATEELKMADRLRQSQKMEAVGQLAGGIAHDFNNILAVISGNLKLASLDLSIDHPAQISLAEIEKTVSRATKIVQQILTFSRNQETVHKVIRLQPIIEESNLFLRATLPANIEINCQMETDAPPVFADATQIHQILMNLGANAVHAMRADGGRLEIMLTQVTFEKDEAKLLLGLPAGQYLRLSVADTGCGMDKDTAQRVFEPFFTTKPPGEGTGLGLTTVHGIMKSHGGTVTVYSELGRGTVFNLYFPAVATVVPPPVAPGEEMKRGNLERIMFVDDEESLVFLGERLLKRLGYEVEGFKDPEDALAAFLDAPDRYDLIMTDLSMPQLDGTKLARQILAVRPEIPIILSTGYVRPQDEETARALGVKEFLLKPIEVGKLATVLQRFIHKKDQDA